MALVVKTVLFIEVPSNYRSSPSFPLLAVPTTDITALGGVLTTASDNLEEP